MSIATFVDMAAALAVTALLAESYGAVRRRLVGNAVAPTLIGVMFGAMAALHMHNPLEPYAGLIIDLRNIPVALAGAFLGWRGLIPCLVIAMLTRIEIGGVGTVSGLWAMVIAGLAGIIWARKMAAFKKRNFGMLLLLALAMSTHLLAAVALPRDLAVWFFTSAVGPILAMNLLVVPLIGALLERENRRIQIEEKREKSASRNAHTGLLTGQTFVREITNAFAAQPLGSFAGVLVIAAEAPGWRSFFWMARKSNAPEVEASLLSSHLGHWPLAGRAANGSILVPITREELETVHRLRASVRTALAENAIDGHAPLYWDVSEIATPDPGEFLHLIERAALNGRSTWATPKPVFNYSPKPHGNASFVTRSRIFDPDEHDALFAKANFLMERSRG
ncbi:LytS/YhcK type 5TM receptor domain-containing protein [Gymnodinialimonas ulvae]|uniref:LytS/YhcK type 5TM receptor domain-containing protein n=1 Tax=Gymnodinialimonas ulvae TaxID=3126504 RepID=UPI0030B32B71